MLVRAETAFAVCSGKAKGPIPQDAVQALDVALKNTASNHPDCVTLPRAFFFYDKEMVKTVGGGAEVSASFYANDVSYDVDIECRGVFKIS